MSATDHPNNTADAPMLVPPWLERIQIKYMNPLIAPVARRLSGFAIVKHRGRKSGVSYETIVSAKRHGDMVIVNLLHGKTNWVKNILAAGEAEIRVGGEDLRITNPRVVPVGHDGADLPRASQRALKRMGVFVADIA